MTTAAQGWTTEHPAVMATSPPSAPFIAMVKSYEISPETKASITLSNAIAETQPHAAARVVVTAQRAAVAADSGLAMANAEPGLNPYHPNQRMNVPRI